MKIVFKVSGKRWKLIKQFLGLEHHHHHHHHRRHARVVFSSASVYQSLFPSAGRRHLTTIKGDLESMLLTDTQEVDLSIAPKDAKGNPAAVEGAPVWASSDPTILTVEAAADGLSAVAKAVGPLGTAQVSVTADADLGEGVKSISGTMDFEVQAGEAVSLGISAGTPREQV